MPQNTSPRLRLPSSARDRDSGPDAKALPGRRWVGRGSVGGAGRGRPPSAPPRPGPRPAAVSRRSPASRSPASRLVSGLRFVVSALSNTEPRLAEQASRGWHDAPKQKTDGKLQGRRRAPSQGPRHPADPTLPGAASLPTPRLPS